MSQPSADGQSPRASRRNRWLLPVALLVGLAPAGGWAFVALCPLRAIDQQLVDAVGRGDSGAARALLARGADPNTRSKPQDLWEPPPSQIVARVWLRVSQPQSRREPVLMAAVNRADAGTVVALLEGGADPDVTDDAGETALICAAAGSRHGALGLPVMGALLAHGAHIDGRNGHRMSPLMFAAFEGTPPAVGFLVRHGADVNARDVEGRPVIAFARRRSGVAALLRRAGAHP